MCHDGYIQGSRVASVWGLALPYLVQARDIAEGNRLVGGQMDLAPLVLGDVLSSEYFFSLGGDSLEGQCNHSLTRMNLGVVIGLLISTHFSFLFSKLVPVNFLKQPELVVLKKCMIDDSFSLLFI